MLAFGTSCGFQQCCNELLISPLNRYVSAQSQVAHDTFTAASGNNSAQSNVLIRENERLRKELEVYTEKAARLQKVREGGGCNEWSSWLIEGAGNNNFLLAHVRVISCLVANNSYTLERSMWLVHLREEVFLTISGMPMAHPNPFVFPNILAYCHVKT